MDRQSHSLNLATTGDCHTTDRKGIEKLMEGAGFTMVDVGYPAEHLKEYCGWLSALARGEALPGV